jgi:hypothetical protein
LLAEALVLLKRAFIREISGITMDRLLDWATSQMAQEDATTDHTSVRREVLDPKWIDLILGGNDTVKMQGTKTCYLFDFH